MVLAGGAGRRIGGAKAIVELRGTPLVKYPLRALQAVLAEVVVVAKQGTRCRRCPASRSGSSRPSRAIRWRGSSTRWRGRARPAGSRACARDPRERGRPAVSRSRARRAARTRGRATARRRSCRVSASACSRCSRATRRPRTRRSRPRCGADPLPSLTRRDRRAGARSCSSSTTSCRSSTSTCRRTCSQPRPARSRRRAVAAVTDGMFVCASA